MSPTLTKLEAAVIDALGRQYPEQATALNAQMETVRVTDRTNTGCGMYVDFEVDPRSPPMTAIGPFGDVVSTIAGLEVHFMISINDGGLATYLEGYSFLEGDISDVDLETAAFTPVEFEYTGSAIVTNVPTQPPNRPGHRSSS